MTLLYGVLRIGGTVAIQMLTCSCVLLTLLFRLCLFWWSVCRCMVVGQQCYGRWCPTTWGFFSYTAEILNFQNASASCRYTAAAVEFYMMRANSYKFLVSVLSYLIQKLSVVFTSCSGRRWILAEWVSWFLETILSHIWEYCPVVQHWPKSNLHIGINKGLMHIKPIWQIFQDIM